MAEEEPRGSHAAIVWGAFILFIGVVILLQATGVLEWRIWGTLWKFWPVIIILFGLGILLRRLNVWLISLLTLAILGVCLGVAIWQHTPNLSGDLRVLGESYSFPIGGVERSDATIDFSAGSIIIEKLTANSKNLVEVGATHDGDKYLHSKGEQRVTMTCDFRQDGLVGKLSLKPLNQQFWNKWDVAWHVDFNPQIPLSLNLKCDASYAAIDLRELKVSVFYMEMNASNGKLKLPVSAGDCIADIDMDVSNLEIVIPEGVAVKIKADVNLSMFSINTERFPRQGDYYISPDYASATNRIELNILCDVSRLVIK